ncbi:MAG: hypothetical protein R3D67_21850 [Hyphomicrobiaceae bacterium]
MVLGQAKKNHDGEAKRVANILDYTFCNHSGKWRVTISSAKCAAAAGAH